MFAKKLIPAISVICSFTSTKLCAIENTSTATMHAPCNGYKLSLNNDLIRLVDLPIEDAEGTLPVSQEKNNCVPYYDINRKIIKEKEKKEEEEEEREEEEEEREEEEKEKEEEENKKRRRKRKKRKSSLTAL